MAMDISKDVPNVLSPSKPETMSRLDQTASIGHELMESGIRVYVRIRPFSKKEISELGTECISVVEVSSCRKKVTLFESTSSNVARGEFTFDYCVSPFQTEQILLSDNNPLSDGDDDDDEIDEEDQAEIAQEEMYALAGGPILQSSWNGFNGCVFAYGQTSSGKTYTMMGTKRDPGIIPRLCRQLFELYENSQSSKKERTTSIQVTFIEIYNEQVRDLLRPKPKKGGVRYTSRFDANPTDTSEYQTLKVRQHPLHGPFVEGITKQVVDSWTQCVQLMKSGNELRVQAQTDMNETSSRSHAIFQMIITHTEALGAKVRGRSVTNHKVSKLNLVDLAGSERMVRSGVTGKQVAEANHINLSLSTLRRVIDALLQNTKSKNSAKKAVIPYRESMLTWILSDNFGGNSKTIMIATVSPAASSWHETEGTLRYATLARGVTNRVKVNEDPSTKIIRELKTQLKALQDEISSVRNTTITSQTDELKQIAQEERMKELQEQIELNERVMDDLLTRENALRKEMDEYKAREQELLKRQEELMKGEIYWRQRAEELTEQSMKLKFELDTLRTGDGPPNLQRKNVSELFWSTLGTTDQPPSEYETSRFQSILAKKRSMRKEKIVAAATAAAVEAEKKSFRVVRPEKVLLTSAEETLSPIVDDLAASCSVHDPEFGEWVEEKMDSEWKSLGPQHGRRAHNLPTSPNPTNAVKSPEQKEINTTLRESSVLSGRRGSEIRGLRAYVIDIPSTTVHMRVQNVAPVTDVLDQFVGEKELFGSKRSTKNTKH